MDNETETQAQPGPIVYPCEQVIPPQVLTQAFSEMFPREFELVLLRLRVQQYDASWAMIRDQKG